MDQSDGFAQVSLSCGLTGRHLGRSLDASVPDQLATGVLYHPRSLSDGEICISRVCGECRYPVFLSNPLLAMVSILFSESKISHLHNSPHF